MGDIGGASANSEIDGIVQRLSTMAREDPHRPTGGAGTQPDRLNAVLEFLPQLRLRTLRALEHYITSPDGLAAIRGWNGWQSEVPSVANFLLRYCCPPALWRIPRSAASIDADLLDLLSFNKIQNAHGETMGYAGVDAYADAKDDCHCMTAAFAQWILTTAPDPARVSGLAAKGRLAKFGISPADLDPDELRAELAKVDVDAEVSVLVGLYADKPQPDPTGPPGRDQQHTPNLADIDDDGKGSFEVTIPPTASSPSTAGDAFEKHISRKDSTAAVKRQKALFWVVCPLAAVAIPLWLAWPLVAELLAGPQLSAWKGLGAFLLAEAVGGCLIALGLSSLLDLRARGYFLVARELNHFTVLQGRRDEEFLQALRVLRPGLFARSATAGLPRLFTVCFDKEGALLVGGGSRPRVVAAFHWLHVREIQAEPQVRGHHAKGGTGQRVVLLVRQEGRDEKLTFPLERAKVAWTSRTFLESDPVKATLALVQGMRTLSSLERPGTTPHGIRKMTPEIEERIHLLLRDDAVLEGTDYEMEALAYEAKLRPPPVLASSAFVRGRQV